MEWNIGEAAGYAAAYCLNNNITPRELRNTEKHLSTFQLQLRQQGFELEWPQVIKQ